MGHRDSTENAVNEPRSTAKTDTPVTRVRSGLVRYEVVDKDGGKHGPFDCLANAQLYVWNKWPDQEQDEDRTGKGWDIQVVGS